ncbi:MAG TPA: DivIVA domain-containing protein [Mycobacteriales bacterium]|nr:DivIVA domain-containing protein [Mycobacteriales bacterium]
MVERAAPEPGGPTVYRVLEVLAELTELVDAARGVPMSASCVLPRGAVLDLLEDIRDALPAELADAQDVLNRREDLLTEATTRLHRAAESGQAERARLVGSAHEEANALLAAAHDQASQVVAAAQAHAERLVAAAQAQAERVLAHGQAEAATTVAAARQDAARRVEESEVHRVATEQAAQLVADARADARKMVADAEEYVDGRLASFSEMLTRTIRQVDMGRQALRERSGQ